MELPSALLSSSSKKIEKIHPEKNFIFQGMELSSSKIKKFLIFQEIARNGSNIKIFLYFFKRKLFLYFKKWNFSIFQETSCISGSNFPSPKSKKYPLLKSFLYFGEMEHPSSKLNKLLIFQHENYFS